jgi:hypothetical protein
MNAENIDLIINDLISQTDNLHKNNNSTVILNKNTSSIFLDLPIQIKANTDEIYNYLANNFIINDKKKPISKNSILRHEV